MIQQSTGIKLPQQSRSKQTLERILDSSTKLIAETSYDELSIVQIASRAKVSVGGFYSRFENKDALFEMLLVRLANETQDRIDDALAADWSDVPLRELLLHVVANNAELYDKYRGVLTAVHVQSRVLRSEKHDSARRKYNKQIVKQIEVLLMRKRKEIRRRRPRAAIGSAVACMTSMLRDSIIFDEAAGRPDPGSSQAIVSEVSEFMYCYLVSEPS